MEIIGVGKDTPMVGVADVFFNLYSDVGPHCYAAKYGPTTY